ncbi:MAG: membrane protein insertase YidC [Candidatus Nealsonbacteria bacterium]|nr:membrane protein insertase YidC [Candidatus Nealsonbacteria bacterium]
MLGNIYNLIFYQPLFNVLILFYQYLPGRDFGVAVILLTVLIRLILYPLMAKSIRSQKILSELQPKVKEIQQKFKNDKQGQAKEIMALYQREKVNPFGGFLPLLLQLPILFALYRVFWTGLQEGQMDNLYSFISRPAAIDPTFLGILNLAQPSIILAVLAGVFQYFQTKTMSPSISSGQVLRKGDSMDRFSGMMQKQMLYLFPLFTVFILWKLPSAIGIYWVVTSLFSIGQQYLIMKPHTRAKLGTGQEQHGISK